MSNILISHEATSVDSRIGPVLVLNPSQDLAFQLAGAHQPPYLEKESRRPPSSYIYLFHPNLALRTPLLATAIYFPIPRGICLGCMDKPSLPTLVRRVAEQGRLTRFSCPPVAKDTGLPGRHRHPPGRENRPLLHDLRHPKTPRRLPQKMTTSRNPGGLKAACYVIRGFSGQGVRSFSVHQG